MSQTSIESLERPLVVSFPLAVTAIWIVSFVIALLLDTPVARWIHDSGIRRYVQQADYWPEILKAPGDFRFNLAVVVVLIIARQINWRQGVLVVLAGVASGLNSVIKWIAGRYRPYNPVPGQLKPFNLEPFWHGWHGFIKQGPLSFPSGHASTSFALAAALVVVWPRGGWVFVVISIFTGLERVSEDAHYCTDVIGAFGFAMLCVLVLDRLLRNWIKPKQIRSEDL